MGVTSLTLKSCGDIIWVGNLEREKAEIFAINLSSRGSFYYANGGGSGKVRIKSIHGEQLNHKSDYLAQMEGRL